MKSAWQRGRGKPSELRTAPASVQGRERAALAKRLRAYLVAIGDDIADLARLIGVDYARASAWYGGAIPRENERERIVAMLAEGNG